MATVATSSSADKPASPQPGTSHMIEDHGYCLSSPRKTKRKGDALEGYALSYKKKLKIEKQRNRRLAARVVSLTDIVKDLRKKNFVSDSCAEMLDNSFSGVPLQLMKRLLQKKGQGESFHPSLKAFAITLQFYSTKAYNFVRDTFGLGLPAITTIRGWLRSVDGNVGFNDSVMRSLGQKVAEARKQDSEVLCALMLDEMAIKKNIEFDGKKTIGFVDIGNGVTDDSAPPATQALVFMLVCVNGSWKVPVGFFFIHGMTGHEKANLIRECLHQLDDVGVKVISVTCDGPSSHMTMLKELGASMNPENIDPSFPHPSSGHRIYVILDVCHMLKLLRNCLATCGLLKDGDGVPIRWRYLEDLNNIQEREGLHLANKLRKAHIQWDSQKMKVKLAAQSFSASVADAMEYCRDGLQLPDFENVQGTVKFLRIINNLFDILNSRNQYARGMKGALKPDTPDGGCSKIVFLEEAFQYVKSLTNVAGNKMYTTNKKTAFVGFLTAIKAVQGIYNEYVGEGKPLKYLLTYKLSQDHLELFFGAVRAQGGSNNNPTVRQFVACFKRMILRHGIKSGTGNVTPQDETTFLMATVSKEEQDAVDDDTKDILMARRYQLISEPEPEDEKSIINEAPSLPELSIYRESAVGYISGYVIRMVMKKIKCPDCQVALYVKAVDGSQPSHGLILQKDQGGLIKPSPSVIDTCLQSEKIFQKLLYVNKNRIPQGEGLPAAIAHVVLQNIGNKVFGSLGEHMLDTQPENNHIFALIKAVTRAYIKIRMHHLVKEHNAQITGKYIRKVMHKLVLFKNQ